MPPVPPDQTSPDDILELSDLVEDKSGHATGLDAASVDMTFEQELEELFSEDLAADDDRLVPPAETKPSGKSRSSVAPSKQDEAPMILDDMADEDDALLLEDVTGPTTAEDASADDDMHMILDDMDDDEPLVLDELGEDLDPSPKKSPVQHTAPIDDTEPEDDIDLLLDEVVLADDEPVSRPDEDEPLDLTDLAEDDDILDLGTMLVDDDETAIEDDEPFELSLDDALEDTSDSVGDASPQDKDDLDFSDDLELSGDLDDLLGDADDTDLALDLKADDEEEEELVLGDDLLLQDEGEETAPDTISDADLDDDLDFMLADEVDQEPAAELDAALDLTEFGIDDEPSIDAEALIEPLDDGPTVPATHIAANVEQELDLDGIDMDAVFEAEPEPEIVSVPDSEPLSSAPLRAEPEVHDDLMEDDIELASALETAGDNSDFDFGEHFPDDEESEDIESLLDGVEIDVSGLDDDLPPLDALDDDLGADLDADLAADLDTDMDEGLDALGRGLGDDFAPPLDTDMAVVMEGDDNDTDQGLPLHVNVDSLLSDLETDAAPASTGPDPVMIARLEALERRLDGLEALLRDEVARTVPFEAARIIREEIQALAEDLSE